MFFITARQCLNILSKIIHVETKVHFVPLLHMLYTFRKSCIDTVQSCQRSVNATKCRALSFNFITFTTPRSCCIASDRKCQQSTNPYLGLQNKDKDVNPSLTMLLLSSLPPVSPPHTSSLPPSYCFAVYTHSCPHGEAWLCHCLPGYLLSQHLVGEKGLACLLPALRMLSSLLLSPFTLCFVLLSLWSRTICCTE